MKNLARITELTTKQLDFFSKFSEEHIYNTPTQIIYKGQIPHAAYILIDGKIIIRDAQKKIIRECMPNTILGLSELFNNTIFNYTAEISAGSKVLILGRYTVLDLQKKYPENTNELIDLDHIA